VLCFIISIHIKFVLGLVYIREDEFCEQLGASGHQFVAAQISWVLVDTNLLHFEDARAQSHIITLLQQYSETETKHPWPESASELYRPSDRRLLVKFQFLRIEVVPWSAQRLSRPYRFSRPEPLLFLSSSSSVELTRLSGPRSRPTPSQRIEPGTSGSVARNSDHWTAEAIWVVRRRGSHVF
jgi:hypothetical protein